MPPVKLRFVLFANLLVSLGYLLFGLFISPLRHRRHREEYEETRAELLEEYRAARERERLAQTGQDDLGTESDADPDLPVSANPQPQVEPEPVAANPPDALSADREGFKTRVLNDRMDVVEEGPAILKSVDAPASEHGPARYMLNTVVMLCCPVAGPLFFALSWVLMKVVFRKPVDVADVIFSKARVKPAEEADPEHEMNITPLTEAVSVTDNYHLRALMLNVLSGEMDASLSAISEALSSDDSESAHYAASFLSDAVNKLRADTQKLYLQIVEDSHGSERVVDLAIERAREEGRATVEEADREYVRRMLLAENCSRYIEMVESALKQNVFTKLETDELVENLNHVAQIFYDACPEEMKPAHFEAVALWLQRCDQPEAADMWLAREATLFPHTLSYHTCRLQVLYARKDREAFFAALEELKNSPVPVDKETLDAIRLFERGDG